MANDSYQFTDLEHGSAALADLIDRAGSQTPVRPVELWNPTVSGEIDIRITSDGSWYYRGSLIRRERLVRLFASVLRREDDGRHVLVTPAERLEITVDDAPFIGVEMVVEGSGGSQDLTVRTNVGDLVRIDANHCLRFALEHGTGGLKPYIRVRGGLEALVNRAVTYQLVELSVETMNRLGVWSGGTFFTFPNQAD